MALRCFHYTTANVSIFLSLSVAFWRVIMSLNISQETISFLLANDKHVIRDSLQIFLPRRRLVEKSGNLNCVIDKCELRQYLRTR